MSRDEQLEFDTVLDMDGEDEVPIHVSYRVSAADRSIGEWEPVIVDWTIKSRGQVMNGLSKRQQDYIQEQCIEHYNQSE